MRMIMGKCEQKVIDENEWARMKGGMASVCRRAHLPSCTERRVLKYRNAMMSNGGGMPCDLTHCPRWSRTLSRLVTRRWYVSGSCVAKAKVKTKTKSAQRLAEQRQSIATE